MKIDWNPQNPSEALLVLSRRDFMEKYPEVYKKALLLQEGDSIKFCRMMQYQQVLCGTFVVPERTKPITDQISFAFVLYKNQLFFIDDKKKVELLLQKFFDQYDMDYSNPLSFLLGFMNFMVSKDVYFLEDYNVLLEGIEQSLFAGKATNMEMFIMNTRKDMNILGNYYTQLNAVGEVLQGILSEENMQEDMPLLSLYQARISQLSNMVETIKDYTGQIWNLRQTQLSDRQNQISTILTIITTIFLPLTLITGWFGMNFVHMPLIRTVSGYYITCGLSVLIVIAEILFIKRKRWVK